MLEAIAIKNESKDLLQYLDIELSIVKQESGNPEYTTSTSWVEFRIDDEEVFDIDRMFSSTSIVYDSVNNLGGKNVKIKFPDKITNRFIISWEGPLTV